MPEFTKQDLRSLVEKRETPCVSLYLPTHRSTTRELQQDPIRFKNLLRQAERSLASELRSAEVQAFLAPAAALLADASFWRHQKEGLAVFLARGYFRSYGLPLVFEELAVVAERFHVKPLLPLLSSMDYLVLALSQNNVRLYRATRFSVTEMELNNIPRSLNEALRLDTPERQLQFHTGTPKTTGGAGGRAAIFHGHGGGADDTKNNILKFFRQVDRGLQSLLRNETAPLVLAGVEYLLPIYREANSYPHLVERGVEGNVEAVKSGELQSQAWEVVSGEFDKNAAADAEKYRTLRSTGRASHDIRVIAPAACHGRVDILFIALDKPLWGSCDPATNAVVISDRQQPGMVDLLDYAAIHTFLNSGTVRAVAPQEVPDGGSAAAIFRY